MSLGHTLLILSIYVLTVASVTRLVNYDVIFDPIRLWPARRASVAHTAAKEAEANGMAVEHAAAMKRYTRWVLVCDFMACPWCVSMWVAAATAPAVILLTGWSWWTLPPLALSARYLVGFCDRWVSEDLTIVDKG